MSADLLRFKVTARVWGSGSLLQPAGLSGGRGKQTERGVQAPRPSLAGGSVLLPALGGSASVLIPTHWGQGGGAEVSVATHPQQAHLLWQWHVNRRLRRQGCPLRKVIILNLKSPPRQKNLKPLDHLEL